jgi:hypothetical protein
LAAATSLALLAAAKLAAILEVVSPASFPALVAAGVVWVPVLVAVG